MTTNRYRDRREADALDRAIGRFEALVRGGMDPADAGPLAARDLDPSLRGLLALSVGLREAAAPVPDPVFAVAFEERLRAARVRRLDDRRHRRSTPGLVTLAAAACVAVLAGVVFAASHSLPGDALYAVKRASETAQVALASGPAEARMRLAFADKRLDEVEGLVARARGQVIGAPGAAVAAAGEVSDPVLAQLIKETLAEATQQITAAAEILIQDASDADSLGKLADLAHKGSTIANDVAPDLPATDQPPVIESAVALQALEAQAKEALKQIPPSPTPEPCDTPTPSPTPEPTASPEATPTATAKASPGATASPEATATADASPSPTPCISPTPETSPVASPDPTSSPEESPAASPSSVEEEPDAPIGS